MRKSAVEIKMFDVVGTATSHSSSVSLLHVVSCIDRINKAM